MIDRSSNLYVPYQLVLEKQKTLLMGKAGKRARVGRCDGDPNCGAVTTW